MNSHSSSPLIGDKKNVKCEGGLLVAKNGIFFRERMSSFSLELWEIGPLVVFGPKRKDVLCRAGYAWTPDL